MYSHLLLFPLLSFSFCSNVHLQFTSFFAQSIYIVVFLSILVFKNLCVVLLPLLLLLVAVIHNTLLLFWYYSSPWIVVFTQSSMLMSYFSLFFLSHRVCLCYLSDERPCVSISISFFLFLMSEFYPCPFWKSPGYLTWEIAEIFRLWDFCSRVCFQDFSYSFFCCFSFPVFFPNKHCTFFNPKIYSYILDIDYFIYFLYFIDYETVRCSFSFLTNILILSIYIYLFLWLSIFVASFAIS